MARDKSNATMARMAKMNQIDKMAKMAKMAIVAKMAKSICFKCETVSHFNHLECGITHNQFVSNVKRFHISIILNRRFRGIIAVTLARAHSRAPARGGFGSYEVCVPWITFHGAQKQAPCKRLAWGGEGGMAGDYFFLPINEETMPTAPIPLPS